MLAATPPMGWNTWNTFGPYIDQEVILATADALVSTGLRDAGYDYLVIDDVWMAPERIDGKLAPDPDRFAMGIGALAEEVHGRGLKFGIYSCAGTHTCERLPASYGYEDVDADTFAGWGVDFLKYDYCYTAASDSAVTLYKRMGQALRATGRPIVYSICEWGHNKPWEWAASIGAHMWRTTGDIFDTWDSVADIGFRQQADLHPYAGPGHWNDPDMLVVGMRGAGHVGRDGLTETEYRTHFALWALQAAPLIIGADVRALDDFTASVLLDHDLIAINQDPLGRQAHRVSEVGHGFGEVWAKPLADGGWAVGLFNTSDHEDELLSIGWDQLGMHKDQLTEVRNLTTGQTHANVSRSHGVRLDRHQTNVLRITPTR